MLAPAAREIDSFISVPPRSLTPARSAAAAPSSPSFTHEAWTFSIHGWRTSRADGVHEQRLAEGRPAAREALEVDRRLHVHERERHELGEAARAPLQVADPEQVPRHVHGPLDVAEHDRRGRAEADPVRGLVHLEPLAGRDLVRAEGAPHLVVEDLGGRARERGEAGVAEQGEVLVERQPERRRALPDLERGERVHVDPGHGLLHGAADLEVGLAGEARVDPALEADLRRAALPRLARAAGDLAGRHDVRAAAQVRGEPALREGAEAAAEVADVRVVDVPRDDVGDDVAVPLPAPLVGGGEHGGEVRAARLEQRGRVLLVELGARPRTARAPPEPPYPRPLRRRSATEGNGGLDAGGPAVLTREAAGVGRSSHRPRDVARRTSARRRPTYSG